VRKVMTAPRRRYQGCLATRLKPADYENCLDNYDNNEEPKGRYPVQWHNPFAMRSALHISMSHPNSQHKNNSHATDVAEGISTNSLMAVARRTVSQCIFMVCCRVVRSPFRHPLFSRIHSFLVSPRVTPPPFTTETRCSGRNRRTEQE
jgi:hypothetical protein